MTRAAVVAIFPARSDALPSLQPHDSLLFFRLLLLLFSFAWTPFAAATRPVLPAAPWPPDGPSPSPSGTPPSLPTCPLPALLPTPESSTSTPSPWLSTHPSFSALL